MDDLQALRQPPFSTAASDFVDLLNQGNRAFLFGAGTSKSAGLPLMGELTKLALGSDALAAKSKTILDAVTVAFAGAGAPNIEDYLSELVDCLAIAQRRQVRGAASSSAVVGGSACSSEELEAAIEEIKRAIASAIRVTASLALHRRFVRAVHRPLRPGRIMPSHTVNYLVLNYDTLFEDALSLERVAYADGMQGGATAWWNPQILTRDDVSARVFKMHGSIDWYQSPDDSLPVRLGQGMGSVSTDVARIMIWPASTKYRETQLDPYAQILAGARAVLRPLTGAHRVLVVCGYSFGDSHINLEIEHALRESEDRLTVVVLSYDAEPEGVVKSWLEDTDLGERIVLLSRRGYFHGSRSEVSGTDLPWWTFETLTRLLEGEQ